MLSRVSFRFLYLSCEQLPKLLLILLFQWTTHWKNLPFSSCSATCHKSNTYLCMGYFVYSLLSPMAQFICLFKMPHINIHHCKSKVNSDIWIYLVLQEYIGLFLASLSEVHFNYQFIRKSSTKILSRVLIRIALHFWIWLLVYNVECDLMDLGGTFPFNKTSLICPNNISSPHKRAFILGTSYFANSAFEIFIL